MSTSPPLNVHHACQPIGGRQDPSGTSLPESRYDSIITEGPLGSWFTLLNAGLRLNEIHSDFRGVFFNELDALLEEADDEAYVRRMADYLRRIRSQYMFVRVERPPHSKRFVLGYVKCERVFSFVSRYKKMWLRLNRVKPMVLTDVENGENKALRLVCVGETDYERALAMHRNNDGKPPLAAALKAKDEEAAMALLDGGDDPNEVDGDGWNALHHAAWTGCRQPLCNRILGMIQNVNAVTNYTKYTAFMQAAYNKHLDVVILLMNYPEIDLNVQGSYRYTALHWVVSNNDPAILAQLLRDYRIDLTLKDYSNRTPLKLAIRFGSDDCVKILREHGAPEELPAAGSAAQE